MLIQFSIGNYKSFHQIVTFSMVAAALTSKDKCLDDHNVFKVDDELSLLKSAAIYGANASGKSNLIAAIEFMRQFVLNSSKNTQADEPIPVEVFRLNSESVTQPAHFEMVFIMGGTQYRYGFEITAAKVVAEWLFYVPKAREARLFERRNNEFTLSKIFKEGKNLKDKTRDNALFLSVVAQFNGATSIKILEWFASLAIISGMRHDTLQLYTLQVFDNSQYRNEIVELVKRLDVGIDTIQLKKTPSNLFNIQKKLNLPDKFKGVVDEIKRVQGNDNTQYVEIITTHRKFDAAGNEIEPELFDMTDNESEGTKKLFALAGPLIDILAKGRVLLVDELDAQLHPLITRALINLFNSNETNSRNAQLIFATHDTNLLSKDIFRRDQIWFAEKNRFGETQLYSLAEYNVRNDASYESNYIQGRYGAIPFIGDLRAILGGAHAEG